MLPESRLVARLLIDGVTNEGWEQAIKIDNILQKSSQATAVRQARLIRLRLESADPALWPLVADGDKEIATQTLFAAAILHSELLRDFIRGVVTDHVRRLELKLSPLDWDRFLSDCVSNDPAVARWTESTRRKLLQVILRILAEARYLESTRSLRLLQPHIHPVVADMLRQSGKQRLLQLMELQA